MELLEEVFQKQIIKFIQFQLNKIAIKQLSILYNDNNIFKIEQLDKRLIDSKEYWRKL